MSTAAIRAKDAKVPTKQRILTAAIRRFSMTSYDDTHLRDIAADVGVDVAYVHRSFGSKEKLFLAVLSEMAQDHGLNDSSLEEIAALFARQVFDDSVRRSEADPEPLIILIRSLALPAAAEPVGNHLHGLFIEPLREKLGDATGLRASMIMAMLIGLRMMRCFLKLPAVSGAEPEQAAETIRQALETIMGVKAQVKSDTGGETA